MLICTFVCTVGYLKFTSYVISTVAVCSQDWTIFNPVQICIINMFDTVCICQEYQGHVKFISITIRSAITLRYIIFNNI